MGHDGTRKSYSYEFPFTEEMDGKDLDCKGSWIMKRPFDKDDHKEHLLVHLRLDELADPKVYEMIKRYVERDNLITGKGMTTEMLEEWNSSQEELYSVMKRFIGRVKCWTTI